MADPWSTVPELRLNLGVYILCMVGGLVGNIMVITVMVREKTSRTFHADTWKTNLFLLSLTVSNYLFYNDFNYNLQSDPLEEHKPQRYMHLIGSVLSLPRFAALHTQSNDKDCPQFWSERSACAALGCWH